MSTCKLDDANVIPRPMCAIEDAAQIVALAEAPMTVSGLLIRLQGRWTRATAASAVQALLASRQIEWATVDGRSDCVQAIGWKPESSKPNKFAQPSSGMRSPSNYKTAKYLPSSERRRQLEQLLAEPHSVKDCADALGMSAIRVKHYMAELRREGMAVIVGEYARNGRGRCHRVYINPTIARSA